MVQLSSKRKITRKKYLQSKTMLIPTASKTRGGFVSQRSGRHQSSRTPESKSIKDYDMNSGKKGGLIRRVDMGAVLIRCVYGLIHCFISILFIDKKNNTYLLCVCLTCPLKRVVRNLLAQDNSKY